MSWFGFGEEKARKLKTDVRVAEITERLCRKYLIHSITRVDPGACDPSWPCADLCPRKLAAAPATDRSGANPSKRH